MAYSFGFSGSTPQTILPTSTSTGGSTSAARALDSFASNTPAKLQSPTFPAIAPAPINQPIKKQTVTTASGDTHTTEYHPPTSGILSGSTSTPNPGGGSTLSAPGYIGTNDATSNTSSGIVPPTSTPASTQPTSTQTPLAGIINSQIGIGQGKENSGLVDARNKLAQDTAESAQVNANLGTTPGMAQAEVQGRQSAAANYYNTKLAADTQVVNNALTSQGQEIGALNNAGTLASPSNTNVTASPGTITTNTLTGEKYSAPTQVSPGNYLASPQTGNAIGNGQATGIQAATNWAIAQQNMEQGKDYQGQAQAISNALQTLQPVQQAIVPYMAANKLDSNGIPFVNQQINKINQQTNPAAYATMESAISEARSYAIQLLGSQSGANPTDVTNSVNSFDFNNFTPAQLNTFLDNLNVLGQYRLSQAQSASQAGYSANNQIGTPAQGMTANTGGSLQSGGANLLNNLPDPVKAIAGGAINIGSDALKALGGAASDVASMVSGATAASVLGI